MFWFRVEVAGLGGKLDAKLVEVQVSKKIFEVQVRAKLCFTYRLSFFIDAN